MSVLEEAFGRATKDLDFRKQRDRVSGFYVRRRAVKLLGQHPSWDSLTLTAALLGERAVIGGYILRKLDVLLPGPDPKFPAHLDLKTMAKISSNTSMTAAAIKGALEKLYPQWRADWIWQIVWRAVAIHDDLLWKSTTPLRELHEAALDELVDRRLRVVERMTCNVNTAGFMALRNRSWSVAGPNGPWNDGMLVRIFDYPFLPKKPFEAHLDAMKQQGWRVAGNMLLRDPPRVPDRIKPSWDLFQEQGTAWVRFRPASSPAPSEAIRRLFELNHQNFLDRSWFYCDHVGAALSVEALWLGRTRRDGGNEAAFDAVLRKPGPGEGYVGFGPVVGLGDFGILMADAADEFFENTAVDFADLQVGDFVLFWNSQMYDLLANGAWRNEFSYVMGVDADPATGKVRGTSAGPQVWLSGHGLSASLYNAMAVDLLRNVAEPFEAARTRIEQEVTANPAVVEVVLNSKGVKAVKWAPYEDFDPPGAWWIEIGQATWKDSWRYPTRDDALKGVRRTVADDPSGGTGYHHPRDLTAIYFPLWEPKVSWVALAVIGGDSWQAYLELRKGDPTYRAPRQLAELFVDEGLAPGLFFRGSGRKVPVVRPRVKV